MSEKKFKVWHIPQLPGEPFEVPADTLEEAVKIQDVLAYYDLFQYDNNIKPDYANMSGVSQWDVDDQEWFDVDEYDLPEGTWTPHDI